MLTCNPGRKSATVHTEVNNWVKQLKLSKTMQEETDEGPKSQKPKQGTKIDNISTTGRYTEAKTG